MSWLRTDDGFTSHPKFSGWKAAQKWAFLELMHYAARYRTEGVIPDDLSLLPRSVDRKLLALAERSGWLDRDDQNRMVIHDFHLYNPKDVTAASRMKAYRERNSNRNSDRHETVSRAQARAVPVPSRPQRQLKAEQNSLTADAALPSAENLEDEDLPDRSDPVIRLLLALRDRDDRTEAVLRSFTGQVSEAAFDFTRDEIERTGGGAGKAVAILKRIREEGTLASPDRGEPDAAEQSGTEEDRRQAWLDRSAKPDVRSPQAFAAAGVRSGGWPDPYIAAANGSVRATENGSGHGAAYIAGLIRNGVITDLTDLETELTLAGVEDEDRTSLVAQFQLAQKLGGRQ